MNCLMVPAGLVAILLSFNSFAQLDTKATIESSKLNSKNFYPTAMLERPFTLPKNSFETGLQFTTSPSKHGITYMHLTYAIMDDLDLGLSWGGVTTDPTFSDINPEKALALNIGYFLFANRYAASMLAVSQGFHFDNQVIRFTSMAMPTSIPLIRGRLALMTFHDDLIRMNWEKYVAEFNLPLRLNWQATNRLYLTAETHLGKLSTDGNHSHILQKTSFSLRGLYAITSALDVFAKAGLDGVQNWSDWQNNFAFMAGINFRGGMLDG